MIDRDRILITLVGTGGAYLLLAAMFEVRAAHQANAQARALALAGVGFLLSAYAAYALQGYGMRGAAVGLLGVACAMTGSLRLVRQRAEKRERERRR
jgi:peptidoglycan/LPS O-acetylase OafA/YrhL